MGKGSSCVTPKMEKELLSELAEILSKGIEGEVAEFGVYNAGSAIQMWEHTKNSGKALHLFDTFEGLPEITSKDIPDNPSPSICKGGLCASKGAADRIRQWNPPPIVHVGLFQEIDKPDQIKYCYVHLDCDLYESYVAAFDYFYPRLSPGGSIVIDDYELTETPGCVLATDEFCQKFGIVPFKSPITRTVIIRKDP